MLSRIGLIPNKWKMSVIFLLVLAHALPLLITAYLLLPNDRNVLKSVSKDPQLSFVQANSTLFVENMENNRNLPSAFKIKLNTISQTNKSISLRQDVTLLFQDGILVAKTGHQEKNADFIVQQLAITSKYNHLYQAISFHYAQTDNQTYRHQMSYDYLYVSATKYGGIQTFHQPETLQQQNWKQIIDRRLHQQLNFEYNDAFQKFEINPNDYFLFPLSQLPIYSSQEQLPGIPAEDSSEVIRKIWNILHENIIMEHNNKVNGSSMPLLLIAKDGTYFTILYRTADGLYHQWDQPVRDELK